jgi:hypothetical protein
MADAAGPAVVERQRSSNKTPPLLIRVDRLVRMPIHAVTPRLCQSCIVQVHTTSVRLLIRATTYLHSTLAHIVG